MYQGNAALPVHAALGEAALALMPMHLLLAPDGQFVSAGQTMRALLGGHSRFDSAFEAVEPRNTRDLTIASRVLLRLLDVPEQTLRGRAVRLANGTTLLNLGFGIGVVDAIRRFDLTIHDFAPNELVMELMFLHEANVAMTDELSRTNLRLEEARSKAEAEAFRDPLTGLFNRRGLEIAFAAVRQTALVDASQQFALAVLDLDHFKHLNDTRGHAAGDEMLRIVAHRLRMVTRDFDTIARVGGDEFVVIIPHLTATEQVEALGQRLIAAIEQPAEVMGDTCHVSASIGVSLSPEFTEITWDDMEAAADQALYAAKRAGRGTMRFARRTREPWSEVAVG